jgi:hypothetical protein
MLSFIDWIYGAIVDTATVENSYLVRPWRELNTAILEHAPAKLINAIKKKNTETSAKIDTPQQVFNSLKEFNLTWSTANVHLPFVKYVQTQLKKKRVDIGHNLSVWPPSLSDESNEDDETADVNVRDVPIESNDVVDDDNNVGDEPTESNDDVVVDDNVTDEPTDDVDGNDDHDDAEQNNSDNENDSERVPMEGI